MITVALYGNSLGLSSIAAGLKGRPGLRVVSAQQLGTTRPDVALFDVAECRLDFSPIDLWKAQPNLLLIGLDLAKQRVLVLSGQSSHMSTIDDLVDVIETDMSLRKGSHEDEHLSDRNIAPCRAP